MPTPRAPALLLALLLVVSGAALAATSRIAELSNAKTGASPAMAGFDPPASALGDFDGDGRKEIVGHNNNQHVYVLSPSSQRVLASFRPDYPPNWGVRPLNSPVVADVDGNGRLDIVVVTSAAMVCRYEFDPGRSSATSFQFDKRWCQRMNHYDPHSASDSGPWVEDVTGDGRMEIFANTEGQGLYAFNHDGTVRWRTGDWGGNGDPTVADLDGDGRKEALFFGDGGEVYAFDAAGGKKLWSFFASKHVWPASIPVAGSAEDLDGDGRKEVVFVARDAHDAKNLKNNHFVLFVLDHAGRLKWKVQPSWGNPLSYTHPVLLDVTGDGKREILLQDWNTMGHKPGNWERLGPANVFAYKHDGTLLWRTQLDNTWSNDDLAVADVDGDGRLEVVAVGPDTRNGWMDGVWYLDAATGAKEQHFPTPGWTVLRGPFLGNMDGSGKLGWAVSVNTNEKGGAYLVYRTDQPCRVAYAGWQNRQACGAASAPASQPPAPPPPANGNGGTGDFSASFTPRSGNEWWVQVKVSANRELSGVDARVNGGAWIALDLKEWGDWAKSIHAVDGSLVEFRARATDGATAQGGPFRWPSGEPVSGGGGSGGGGTAFSAQFRNPRGNDWWVEVDVLTSGGTLAGVDARVNGGAWIALDRTSWGSWAKSTRVDPGSQVEFRVRATDGGSVVSQPYAWPPG